MPDSRVHINTGVSLASVAGALPKRGPWPLLGGSLFAGYMIGHGYGAFARARAGRLVGAGFDWSGNGRHITAFGDLSSLVDDYGITAAVIAGEPATPFTRAQLLATNSAFSIVCLAYSVSTARTVALARTRTDVTDPATGLILFPQSGDIRADAQATSTGDATATIGSDELGHVSLYGATFSTAARTVYAKAGATSTKTATDSTTLTSFSDAEAFEFGDEAGSGSANTVIHGLAFYDKAISQAEFEAILLQQRDFNDAIGSTGLTV